MTRLVDLSRPLFSGRGHAAGADGEPFGPPLLLIPAARPETHGFLASRFNVYAHAGTHLDAPRHFIPGGTPVGGVPLENVVGPALVADLTGLPPRTIITPAHLAPWLERLGRGGRLLLKTGWSLRYGEPDFRAGAPRLGLEAAAALVARNTRLLGVESVSVADVNNPEETTAVHRLLLAGGVSIVEGLCRLERLTSERPFCVMLPLAFPEAEASPVRAVALEEEPESGNTIGFRSNRWRESL